MFYVNDVEEIKSELLDIFPDAVRGSVAKSRWGNGRKLLHLCYFFGADTAGGYMIKAKGQLLYFIEWDTNVGCEYIFAESDIEVMVKRVREMFKGRTLNINRPVRF